MHKTSIRRSHPVKPQKKQLVHETKVVDMVTARALLRTIFFNLKQTIDQETLVDFRHDGTSTNVAFVIGTLEMKFDLVEGGRS